MTRQQNGIKRQQNKVMHVLNTIWDGCMRMAMESRKIIKQH
jgi:hypothetical protein